MLIWQNNRCIFAQCVSYCLHFIFWLAWALCKEHHSPSSILCKMEHRLIAVIIAITVLHCCFMDSAETGESFRKPAAEPQQITHLFVQSSVIRTDTHIVQQLFMQCYNEVMYMEINTVFYRSESWAIGITHFVQPERFIRLSKFIKGFKSWMTFSFESELLLFTYFNPWLHWISFVWI